MPIPRIAIVGRPNAGKSSLMNMIAKSKVSIVDPTPGVTRDRVAAIVDLEGPNGIRSPKKTVEFMDTGGFGVYAAEGERFDEVGADLATLTDDIEGQIAAAVEGADLILFAIDAQAGITPHDQQIAKLLREGKLGAAGREGKAAKGGKGKKGSKQEEGIGGKKAKQPRIRVVATKVDGPKWEAHAHELSALGFGEPLMVSSMNNYMRREFLDAVYELTPEEALNAQPEARADLMLAIVGKRNAGKSTLVNALAGEPRVIVSEIAGTTRDAIDVRFEMDGKSLVAIDTAGVRRKKSFQNQIEHWAMDRAERAIERADVILLLLDATEKISQVDEQIAALAQKSWKPTIIVVNKWDLAEGQIGRDDKPVTPEKYEDYLRKELRGLTFAPIAFISGKDNRNVRATIELAFELKNQASERVTTGKLNRLIREIVTRQGPTDTTGTQAKVFFVAQTQTNPPTITIVVNHPELFRPNYQRFLMNRLREETPFVEVPLRLVIRERRQREDDTKLIETGKYSEKLKLGRGGTRSKITKQDGVWVADEGEFDESILSDAQSAPVEFEDDEKTAEDYFDEE
ncbi:MAG: ribosome biogenesis GTPase Der [Phycisphaerae bacterium]|nr:ribosome biogenesis GTPase Der [Phycisphaerae bacterium]MBN8597391.1 ribosome biogenesis GTPase Der [Planctomycetota bacterium]